MSTSAQATPSPISTPVAPSRRVASVDALRGLVMIIMALDHTRDYFHSAAMLFSPEDLTRTTPALFFTRWVTHLCAPTFMFTAGLGAYFLLGRLHDKRELSRYLWLRGLWLVVLELTVCRFALTFNLTSGPIMLLVLWALGWSMVALGFLVRLPIRVLAALSIAAIVLHNLTDHITAQQLGAAGWIWTILHERGILNIAGTQVLFAYPLIPWIFVMAAGFCFGPVLTLDPPKRARYTALIGLALTVGFVVIRFLNIYGDPQPWSGTLLSFLRTTKYPASLDYLLMTLGPALLLMAWFDRFRFTKTNPLIVFGRVPLFYFLLHLFVIHLLTIPFALVKYGHAGFLIYPPPNMGGPEQLFPPNYGYSLLTVYLAWITVLVLLYPVCRWYAEVKQRNRSWWLSYL